VYYIYTFINLLLYALTIAIFARALFSWFDPGFTSWLGRILFEITEPILRPMRSVIPRLGMVDISPFIAIILIYFLQTMLRTIFFG
jgi:YggT family protein